MLTDVHLVKRSSNSKIGPIATSYRPQTTCPSTCRFLPSNEGGCYATGRINGMAKKYSKSYTHAEAAETLRGATMFRDRVVGDCSTADGLVDYDYINSIADVCAELDIPAFSYTHMWQDMDVTRIPSNYVMNASTESIAEAAMAVDLGFPTVITSDDIAEGTIINGKRVVTCPAQTRDNVTCATCKLCSKSRSSIIRFLVHGIAKNKARNAIAAVSSVGA